MVLFVVNTISFVIVETKESLHEKCAINSKTIADITLRIILKYSNEEMKLCLGIL